MDRVRKPHPQAAVTKSKRKKVKYPTMAEALERMRQPRRQREYHERTETEIEKQLIAYKTRKTIRHNALPPKLQKMFRCYSFEIFLRRDLTGLHPDADHRDNRLLKEIKRQREQQREPN
jgi:hypothetical protein